MYKKMNKDKLSKPHIVFDAIHQVMNISKNLVNETEIRILKEIIDLPEFQRLRGIKQLGLADMVFPTATHTRFSHSLGTAYLASKIIKKLNENPNNNKINSSDTFILILSALLHDVGHGPFSHTFELFINDILSDQINKKITHVDWSKRFIEYFSNHGPIGSYCNRIKEIMDNKDDYLLSSIISSQLDCDRLDYLLRDSHFCGVSYGTYDLEWLLNCLEVVKNGKGHDILGINQKGIGSVEDFLLGRRLMYANICYNKTLLGFEDILVLFLKELYLWIEDPLENEKRKEISGRFLYEFMRGIYDCKRMKKNWEEVISYTFAQYRKLSDYDIWHALKNIYYSRIDKTFDIPDTLYEPAAYLIERKKPLVIEIDDASKNKLIKLMKKYSLDNRNNKIKIIEQEYATYKPQEDEIYVLMGGSRSLKISERSTLLKHFSTEDEKRIFVRVSDEIFNEKKFKNIKELLEAKK